MLSSIVVPILLVSTMPGISDSPTSIGPECDDPRLVHVGDAPRLAVFDAGTDAGEPVLLIGGTDQQLTDWPPSLISTLVAKGFRPIAYDARDVGCSSSMDEAGAPDWPAIFTALASGKAPVVPYQLADLADETVAVADAAGVRQFHVLAVSGGTATAAMVADRYPGRIASMVLLMPGSGDPAIPVPADPKRLAGVPAAPAADAPRDAVIAYRTALGEALEGSGPRRSQEQIASWARAATGRAWNPDGIARNGAAILAAGDLRTTFARIRVPAVVIHGLDDPLIAPAHGRTVADAIAGARFEGIAGLGHSLPEAVVGTVVDAMVRVANAARGRDAE
jgi:pimeloyl-ACP methyl ester carboxylesterase